MFDFDTIIERRNTDSVKYDGMYDEFGVMDILPMWVAVWIFSPLRLSWKLCGNVQNGVFSVILSVLKKEKKLSGSG